MLQNYLQELSATLAMLSLTINITDNYTNCGHRVRTTDGHNQLCDINFPAILCNTITCTVPSICMYDLVVFL